MKTKITIDWREWHNWNQEDDESSISALNRLLGPHGIQIRVESPEESDWVTLIAETQAGCSWYPQAATPGKNL